MGPRQAPMLAGRLANSAPYGWNGDARDVAAHLESTFRRLHGTGLAGAAGDSALVAEGDAIYHSADAQCASCHGDDGRTPDGVAHDVRSEVQEDTRSEFDTPSLAFVAGTAPYYHDGRYPTLRALLVGSRGRMGQKRALSAHELDALEAYLRTL
jgi:mono/diheme cytochrome c family protein